MEDDKQKKIMKEIENLTPYLTELQEFKENGLFLPESAKNKHTPIFDQHGKRLNKEKRKSKNELRKEEAEKALKIRVLAINKWLDERFQVLFPKWITGLIRKHPRYRGLLLNLMFTKVEIRHKSRPVPYGSDLITIKCFWSKYDEVKFVWEK